MISLIKRVVNYILGRKGLKKKDGIMFQSFGINSFISYPYTLNGSDRISIGANTCILGNSRLQNFGDNSNNLIQIGNHCYICFYFTILNASKVKIGDNVLIASHVLITSENHSIDPESDIPYMDQPLESKPVEIGDCCWVGEKVCVLPGVKIGKKCVIGAGSVVTKSIPDYCIAVGNPAKVVKKYNFETHQWEKV